MKAAAQRTQLFVVKLKKNYKLPTSENSKTFGKHLLLSISQ